MLVLKFALLTMLLALVWMMTLRENLGSPYGGPYYYADPPGASNPVQPKYRLNLQRALASQRYVAVYFNEAGLPLLAKHYEKVDGKPSLAWQAVWVWDVHSRLMRRFREDPAGKLLEIDVMPDLSPSPAGERWRRYR